MKQKFILTLIALLLIAMIYTNDLKGQDQGTWAIGWSIGFVTKGGGFIKYYVADGLSVEVFGGGFPHIYHFGGELSFHPLMIGSADYRNIALTAGYSVFGSSGRSSSYSGQGFNFGADFLFTTKQSEFFTKDGYRENFFFSLGGTYITKSKETKYEDDSNQVNSTILNGDQYTWRPFFEGGVKYFQAR